MNNEKVMELSTNILCALINNGFLPPAVLKGAENSGEMIQDYLYTVAKKVRTVHHLLEGDSSSEYK